MSANFDIEPIHLRTYELNYELRIRKVVTDRVDIELKRKYLRRELKKDLARPETHVYVTPNFEFNLEQRELNDSIKSVTDLVNDYDGINVELGNRIRSRINHILGRLGRIPENTSDEICNYRGDNIIVVSALEEELAEIIERYRAHEQTRVSSYVLGEAGSSGVANKSVPVYKWPVKFSGKSDECSLNSFLQRVEELRIARKCSKAELFEASSDLFEGYALEWFRAQLRHKRFDSWDSLVGCLRQDFLPSNYDSELWRQIGRRTQHVNEPVVIYISIMENLFECLSEKPSEGTKLKILMSQVLPEYQSHLALQNITEVSRLVAVCRALEDSEKNKNTFRPPPNRNISTLEPGLSYTSISGSLDNNVTCSNKGQASECCGSRERSNPRGKSTYFSGEFRRSTVNTSRENNPKDGVRMNLVSEIHCWKCKGVGHVKRDCKKVQRVPTCFGCGKKGVIRPNCPNCYPKNGSKEDEK